MTKEGHLKFLGQLQREHYNGIEEAGYDGSAVR
jgi:hypothetical protein